MMPPGVGASSAAAALLRTLWAASTPATLQGADYRLLDVNDAYAALVGQSRAALVGRDPIDLQPVDDRAFSHEQRRQGPQDPDSPDPMRRRLLDAQGRERWFQITLIDLARPGTRPLWLSLWHDQTAEHDARQQAQRAEDELAHWFELSVGGMLVYDQTGLILRCNAAFETLVERVPEVLQDAPAALQGLLAWDCLLYTSRCV